MGLFGTEPRKKRTPRAVLNSLKRRLAKKQRKLSKKKEKEKIRREIDQARKKLRGY